MKYITDIRSTGRDESRFTEYQTERRLLSCDAWHAQFAQDITDICSSRWD